MLIDYLKGTSQLSLIAQTEDDNYMLGLLARIPTTYVGRTAENQRRMTVDVLEVLKVSAGITKL